MSSMPKRRASPTRKVAPMNAVEANDTRPNDIEVALKQACQTEVLGPFTPTRPEAIAPNAAAKKNGASTEDVPNTTLVRRHPCGPIHTCRKAKNAPREMSANRAAANSG